MKNSTSGRSEMECAFPQTKTKKNTKNNQTLQAGWKGHVYQIYNNNNVNNETTNLHLLEKLEIFHDKISIEFCAKERKNTERKRWKKERQRYNGKWIKASANAVTALCHTLFTYTDSIELNWIGMDLACVLLSLSVEMVCTFFFWCVLFVCSFCILWIDWTHATIRLAYYMLSLSIDLLARTVTNKLNAWIWFYCFIVHFSSMWNSFTRIQIDRIRGMDFFFVHPSWSSVLICTQKKWQIVMKHV